MGTHGIHTMRRSKQKKKKKPPGYERPPPIVSAERGRYYAPLPTKDDGYSLGATHETQVMNSFLGTLHLPGWTLPDQKDTEDKKTKKKGKGKKKGKKGKDKNTNLVKDKNNV